MAVIEWIGHKRELTEQSLTLCAGLKVLLCEVDDGELMVQQAVIEHSRERNYWVARLIAGTFHRRPIPQQPGPWSWAPDWWKARPSEGPPA